MSNLFDLYFEYVEKTEPPIIFHRWSLITCVSALLGRQTWMPFGPMRIFPNQYIMLIGESGSRKTTAIKIAKRVLTKTGYRTFAAEKTYKEKFLLDLQDGMDDEQEQDSASKRDILKDLLMQDLNNDNTEPREAFIVADEFNDFMRCGDGDFHSLLGVLWDRDDEDIPYRYRLKNSKSVSVYQPTINILSGNTHEGFNDMFPPQSLGQGFLSRLILVFSEPSGKKYHIPKDLSDEKLQAILRLMESIKKNVVGAFKVSKKADEMLEVLYNTYEGFNDMRFTAYFTRRHVHLLKMCIACAAMEVRTEILAKDVLLANTILKYTEHFMPKALGEFGKAKNADVAAKILSFLSKTHLPVTDREIWKQVSSDLDKAEEMHKMLAGLLEANKIQRVKVNDRSQGFMIVRNIIKQEDLYVNYNLLKEYERHKIK